ncbi:MAG: NADP(H)-dependent aldo-keto reductase [Pseudomonadota bacterium]|jgi:aryl-alcohol dehydrogenase-like predicted oxidoreductase
MKRNTLGRSDLEVSRVCLGTMTFGQQTSEAEAHAQLDYAAERGVNFIDAAEMYPVPARADTYGRTEEIVGNWLARQPRDKFIIATKIAGPARNLKWIRGGPPALDRANIRAAIEGSLRRLRTEYVDLYQLHWPERNTPLFGAWQFDPARERECTPVLVQLEALGELVREGKVRYVGLSNETPWGVAQFVRLAESHGLPRVISVQNAYSLLNRVFEYGLAETCYREEVGLLAYSPLAFGHLTGKYLDDPRAPGRVNLFENFGQRYTKPNVAPAARAYVELARAHGMTPATLALAFVYGRWFAASTLIGASTLEQLRENLAAYEVALAPEILQEIEAIHLRYTNPAP